MAHDLATALEQNARRTGCTGRKAAAVEPIDRRLFATRGRRHGTSRCAAAESTARNEKNKGRIRENMWSFFENEWSFPPPLRRVAPKDGTRRANLVSFARRVRQIYTLLSF